MHTGLMLVVIVTPMGALEVAVLTPTVVELVLEVSVTTKLITNSDPPLLFLLDRLLLFRLVCPTKLVPDRTMIFMRSMVRFMRTRVRMSGEG